MREIPAEVRELLKNRSMIGENKPSHEVTVGGSSGDVDFTKWTTEHRIIEYGNGNMSKTKDDRAIACYVDNKNIYIAFADSVSGVLSGNGTFGTGIKIKDGSSFLGIIQSSINLIDDVLYLVFSYSNGTNTRVELYTDETGLGTNFSKKSDIMTSGFVDTHVKLSVVTKLGNGNLVIICPANGDYGWHRPVAY